MVSGVLRGAENLATYIGNRISTALNSVDVDKTAITSSSAVFTVLATYSALPDITYSTKNLGQPAVYHLRLVCTIFRSLGAPTTVYNIIIAIDGVDQPGSELSINFAAGAGLQTVTATAFATLSAGSVITARWRTPTGTLSCVQRTLYVDGTPLSQIAI